MKPGKVPIRAGDVVLVKGVVVEVTKVWADKFVGRPCYDTITACYDQGEPRRLIGRRPKSRRTP